MIVNESFEKVEEKQLLVQIFESIRGTGVWGHSQNAHTQNDEFHTYRPPLHVRMYGGNFKNI